MTCENSTETLDVIMTPRDSHSFGPEVGAEEAQRVEQDTTMTTEAAAVLERMAEEEAMVAAAAAEAMRLSALTVTAEEEHAARALSLVATDEEKQEEKYKMLVEKNMSRISHINEAKRQAHEDRYMNRLRTFKKNISHFEKFLVTPQALLDNDTPVEAAQNAYYHSSQLDKMLKAMAINPKRHERVLLNRSSPLFPPHFISISTCTCPPFRTHYIHPSLICNSCYIAPAIYETLRSSCF